MQYDRGRSVRISGVRLLLTIALVVLPGTAMAKHEPKTYPESGKVIATGLNQHNKSHPVSGGQNGTPVTGGGTYTVYSHTYKIETDTKIYELDCGKVPMFFHTTGKGCGGEKEVELGDAIRFRIEKDSAYISLPDGSEQKLRLLNQELKPEAKATDAKPADAKQ
jgi:hypothetical protein